MRSYCIEALLILSRGYWTRNETHLSLEMLESPLNTLTAV